MKSLLPLVSKQWTYQLYPISHESSGTTSTGIAIPSSNFSIHCNSYILIIRRHNSAAMDYEDINVHIDNELQEGLGTGDLLCNELDSEFVKSIEKQISKKVDNVGHMFIDERNGQAMTDIIKHSLTDQENKFVDSILNDCKDSNTQLYTSDAPSCAANLRILLDDEVNVTMTDNETEAATQLQHSQLEQSLISSQLNEGSSSMHVQPVQDHGLTRRVNHAVEDFYIYAYQWFKMVHCNRPAELEVAGTGCRPLLELTPAQRSNVMTKADVGKFVKKEILSGRALTEQFMEAWTQTLLDSIKYAFLCPSCDAIVKNAETFEQHMIYFENGYVRCPYLCGKELARFRNLEKHLGTVHKFNRRKPVEGGEYECKEEGCGRTFTKKSGLTAHMVKAHQEGSRACRVCKVTFENGNAMRQHLLVRHGINAGEELPFVCDVDGCNVRCHTKRGVKNHKAISHKIYDQKYANHVRCTVKGCGQVFRTIQYLQRHVQKYHQTTEE